MPGAEIMAKNKQPGKFTVFEKTPAYVYQTEKDKLNAL